MFRNITPNIVNGLIFGILSGSMKKRVFTLTALCILSEVVYCATIPKPGMRPNAVSGELGGNGLFLSVNYERIVAKEDGYFVAGQLGIGSVPFAGGVTISHQITINFGKEKSFLETGLGGTYWTGASNASGYTETEYSYNISPVKGLFEPADKFERSNDIQRLSDSALSGSWIGICLLSRTRKY